MPAIYFTLRIKNLFNIFVLTHFFFDGLSIILTAPMGGGAATLLGSLDYR